GVLVGMLDSREQVVGVDIAAAGGGGRVDVLGRLAGGHRRPAGRGTIRQGQEVAITVARTLGRYHSRGCPFGPFGPFPSPPGFCIRADQRSSACCRASRSRADFASWVRRASAAPLATRSSTCRAAELPICSSTSTARQRRRSSGAANGLALARSVSMR